jgi:hypothetical protein
MNKNDSKAFKDKIAELNKALKNFKTDLSHYRSTPVTDKPVNISHYDNWLKDDEDESDSAVKVPKKPSSGGRGPGEGAPAQPMIKQNDAMDASPMSMDTGSSMTGAGVNTVKSEEEPHEDDPHHEEKEKKIAQKIKTLAEDQLDMHKGEEVLKIDEKGQWSLEKRCWEGYKPVKGKKPYEKGSCEPE